MSVQLILGGSGCGKSYYIQNKIRKEAKENPEKNYILLVPEQFTMQTQKAMIRDSKEKGILNIDVQSFIRLAFRIFEETGMGKEPVLDDMGKTMILKKVLNGIKEDLVYFGKHIHKTGYIQEIKSFLSEMLQYGMDIETLEEMIQQSEKYPILQRKLEDMKKIYTAFMEYIRENYIASEEVISLLATASMESELLQNSVVYLDGFTGFTPTQYDFIEKLIRVAPEVYVTVTIDDRESVSKVGDKHSLFNMSQKTIMQIRKLALDNKVELCPDFWTGKSIEETRFSEAKGIAKLEKQLYRYPIKAEKSIPEDISIHILKKPEEEMEFVAGKIKEIVRTEGCRYRDIAVITGDLESYGMIGEKVFLENKIPYFIDQKKKIEENLFVDLILNTLDIFLLRYPMEKMIGFGKNPLSLAPKEDVMLLDNYLRASGIRGRKRWVQEWSEDDFRSFAPEKKRKEIWESVENARKTIVDEIEGLYSEIGKGKHAAKEFCEALNNWFISQNYYKKLVSISKKHEENHDLSLAREYKQIYEIVLGVLDSIVAMLGEETMTLKEFKEILEVGFSEARVGLIPPGVDQVIMGDMNRSRLTDIKHLFFIGLTDSNINKSGGHGGVLSDAERLFLEEEEFALAPSIREKVYTAQYYMYLNLTKPSKHLYLSYSEVDSSGKALSPAYIVDMIGRIFPNMKKIVEETRKDANRIVGNQFGVQYLIDGLRREDIENDVWRELYRFYKQDAEREQLLKELTAAAVYQEKKTRISQEIAEKIYEKLKVDSVSQFEQYSACAFAYFMKYGLKLKERQEHQVAFFDIGNIVHGALEMYTRELVEKKIHWSDVSEEEQGEKADFYIDEMVKNYKNDLLHQTKRDTYLVTRLKRILRRTIWAITKQMAQGDFDTVNCEMQFEIMGQTSGKEIFEKEKQKQDVDLRFIGRIDRVDTMEKEGKTYVKIVDYKTGQKNISLSDLYYGLQMQLMVYMQGVTETEKRNYKDKIVIPAGVFYYNIDDPMVKGKLETEKLEKSILKELNMDGVMNEDDPVLTSLDRNLMDKDGNIISSAKSEILPIGFNKDGSLSKTTKTINTQEFQDVLTFTERKLKGIKSEILEGNVEVNPYKFKGNTDKTACDYCKFQGICRFDMKIPGNYYRELDKLSWAEAKEKIIQEVKTEDE